MLFQRKHLADLEAPLAVGACRISRQCEIVAELARNELGSVLASSLLAQLKTLQGLLQAERQRIRVEIGE